MTKAKANAAAKAKTRAATASKARVARDGQTRRAALGALAANDTSAETYTKPKPKPQTDSQQASTAPTARGSKVASSSSRDNGVQRSSRGVTRTSAPSAAQSSSGGWVRPLSGGTYTSGYGFRWGRMHSGVDFAVPIGTPLRAMGNGTVTAAGTYGGQGNRIVVRFDNGTEAHYAHMSTFAVSAGQRVSAGQTIGASGNSGNSTGPHLHLEIHIGGSPINPAGWLAARGLA